MGPFSGQRLHISTSVMDGSRPSTSRTISIDTRFMNQWMQATHRCGVSILHVSKSTVSTDSNIKPLIPLKKETSSAPKKALTTEKVEERKDNKRSGRRRNRRKAS